MANLQRLWKKLHFYNF